MISCNQKKIKNSQITQKIFRVATFSNGRSGAGYQDIQTAEGSWYGLVEMILPNPESREISVSQSVPGPKGSLSILIFPSMISNYSVYCIEDQNLYLIGHI